MVSSKHNTLSMLNNITVSIITITTTTPSRVPSRTLIMEGLTIAIRKEPGPLTLDTMGDMVGLPVELGHNWVMIIISTVVMKVHVDQKVQEDMEHRVMDSRTATVPVQEHKACTGEECVICDAVCDT